MHDCQSYECDILPILILKMNHPNLDITFAQDSTTPFSSTFRHICPQHCGGISVSEWSTILQTLERTLKNKELRFLERVRQGYISGLCIWLLKAREPSRRSGPIAVSVSIKFGNVFDEWICWWTNAFLKCLGKERDLQSSNHPKMTVRMKSRHIKVGRKAKRIAKSKITKAAPKARN